MSTSEVLIFVLHWAQSTRCLSHYRRIY